MFIFVKRLRVSPIIQCSMLYLTSGLFLTQASFNLFLNGPIPASFCLFSSFFDYNINNKNWKKHRWCSWDSKPQPQDGRRRKNGAMVAPKRPSILSDLFITLLNEIWRYLHYIFFSSVLHLLQCFLIWHLSLPPLSPTFLMKISPHCATPLFVSLGSWHTRINGDKKYKLLLYKIA